MKLNWMMVLALLTLPFSFAGCAHRQSIPFAQPLPAGLSPAELQGYRDGVAAAQQDMRADEPPDVRKQLQFRHPPVAHVVAGEYRQEFRAGYGQTIRGGSPPAGY